MQNQGEGDLARTKYHYYEHGNKTGELLVWQIKKEESDHIIHSIITDDGRFLTDLLEINAEFNFFYETNQNITPIISQQSSLRDFLNVLISHGSMLQTKAG